MVTAMNNLAGNDGLGLSVKDVRTIVHRRGEFQQRLRECFYDIIDIWPDVLTNEARRYEISNFLSRYRSVRLAIREAAESPALVPPLGDALLRYVRFLNELDSDMTIILDELHEATFPGLPGAFASTSRRRMTSSTSG